MIHRRTVLKLAIAGGAALLVPDNLLADSRRQQSVIMIRDIDPSVSAELLDAVLAPLPRLDASRAVQHTYHHTDW